MCNVYTGVVESSFISTFSVHMECSGYQTLSPVAKHHTVCTVLTHVCKLYTRAVYHVYTLYTLHTRGARAVITRKIHVICVEYYSDTSYRYTPELSLLL